MDPVTGGGLSADEFQNNLDQDVGELSSQDDSPAGQDSEVDEPPVELRDPLGIAIQNDR